MPLCASGRKETRFAEIDAYIEQRDYSQALMLLQEYIIDYPEDFDSAQKRIQRIIESRTMYSKKADELIDVIINEPSNDQKKLEMIAELESLEKNPSQASVDFIKQTKAAAQFTYFRSLFDELMLKGSNQIAEGNYTEAVQTFYSGLDLYQEDFFDQNYDEQYSAPVIEELATIKQLTEQFDENYIALTRAYNTLKSSLSTGNLTSVLSDFETFQDEFNAFSLKQQAINRSGRMFQELFTTLSKEYKDLTEASFLPFAYRFILGKTDSQDTGIIAAYNLQWNLLIPSLKPHFTAFLKKMFSNSLSDMKDVTIPILPSTHDELLSSLSQIKTALETAQELPELYTLRETLQGERDKDTDSLFLVDIGYLSELCDYFIAELDVIQLGVKEHERVSVYSSTLNKDNDSSTSYGQEVFTATESLLAFLQELNAIEDTVLILSRKTSPVWKDNFDLLSSLTAKTEKYILGNIDLHWSNLAVYVETWAFDSSSFYLDNFEEAKKLLNPDLVMEPGVFEVRTYPKESIPVFNSVLSSIDTQIASLREKADILKSSSQISDSLYSDPIQSREASIQNLIAQLSNIKTQTSRYIALADERIILSERAKNEAVLRYNQAIQALNTNNFQTARDNLQRARTKYNESLSFQESQTLRDESDALLFDLGNEISRSENEVIVREVRKLKTDAKNAYYQGNFERAENLLTQAQSRWATTNVEPDIEISNLLSLVGTALSMKTGRVISTSAPLYPEMSQILSLAKQYFDQGRKLITEGNRTEGILILNEAKQKLRELQLVYPLNQEASLLTLRIDQVIDPDAFDALFEQKFIAAKADFRTTDKRQTAYADLLDLYAINPRYTGLGDFIYQAEIELGIKVKPPDKKALAESATLTKEAATVVNSASRDEIALNAALVKLNTALEKNPDNEEAMVLKDRIQTIIGGKASVVLSSESEALYQRAIQELQKGNTLQAAALVSQLLQKKENQNSSKIIDLKKKVDSLL